MNYLVYMTFPYRGWLGWNVKIITAQDDDDANVQFLEWAKTHFASLEGMHYQIARPVGGERAL